MTIELLISAAIVTAIVGGMFALMSPVRGMFHVQPEISDMQQRMRVGVDALAKDLLMAGAGSEAGAAAGPLTMVFAPVLPFRIGERHDDRARNVFYRDDAVAIVSVPQSPQASTVEAMTRTGRRVRLSQRSSEITPGMRLLIADSGGRHDVIAATRVEDDLVEFEYEGVLAMDYPQGTSMTGVSMHTYYLKSDVSTRTFQLMRDDGIETDVPVLDHIVDLEFQYFGDPLPPVRLSERPLTGKAPWTTYGPKPPPVGEEDAPWPAGENCIFVVDPASGQHVARLPVLGAGGDIPLAEAMLTDGPWCPDATVRDRFDADLLRVRRVRVTLRVQVAQETLRGPAGPLFARGGTFTGATRLVPDLQIQFDVAPRNMNLTR